MRVLPTTLRGWIVVVYAAIGIGLLPWTIWLSESLKPRHLVTRWDLAWSGFDTGLAILFVGTAIAAYRRSAWLGALAAATGTVLVVDAWFDVVLESHADDLRNSIILAVVAELPAAAMCFWIAFRAERWVALHLSAAAEGAAEGDLVRVLEVPPDG